MQTMDYFTWLTQNTPTTWWHDSADPVELQNGLDRHAVGVTTNPFLSNLALRNNKDRWAKEMEAVLQQDIDVETKADLLMQIPVSHAAGQLLAEFKASQGIQGYVCAQVNPARAGDRDAMLTMARRHHQWAPNIAVKLPATLAGLDVLEECIAEGISVTATVSFTVPQVLAIAERHRQGVQRAKLSNRNPGKCFAVIMIGRLDDYLRDVARDSNAAVTEEEICQAGLAVTKRAYSLYQERNYEAVLLVAALRGTYHMTELAGAELIMSIAPSYQELLLHQPLPQEERMERPVDPKVIDSLTTISEFVRSYEPDGMAPEDFIGFGATQRTLTQFSEAGWKLLEQFQR